MSDVINTRIDGQQVLSVQSRDRDTRLGPEEDTTIKVTLYKIDSILLDYLSNRVKPIVTQNGNAVVVPVVYGDSERWKSSQKDGVLRDSVGKIQLPMIMMRRGEMKKSPILNAPVNKYLERTFNTGWNRRTPYDQFSVANNVIPSREYYSTPVPDYYEITYNCIIWTEYMEQMNGIVENVSFESDQYWGEDNGYKFRAVIKSFSPKNELPIDGDRVVRTEFSIIVHTYLLPDSMLDKLNNRSSLLQRRFSLKKSVTFIETETK